jgi:hypothetical protein
MSLPPPVEFFLRDIEERFGAESATTWREAFDFNDLEADGDTDACALFNVLVWIASQHRTLDEKLVAMDKVFALEGYNQISLPEFVGW